MCTKHPGRQVDLGFRGTQARAQIALIKQTPEADQRFELLKDILDQSYGFGFIRRLVRRNAPFSLPSPVFPPSGSTSEAFLRQVPPLADKSFSDPLKAAFQAVVERASQHSAEGAFPWPFLGLFTLTSHRLFTLTSHRLLTAFRPRRSADGRLSAAGGRANRDQSADHHHAEYRRAAAGVTAWWWRRRTVRCHHISIGGTRATAAHSCLQLPAFIFILWLQEKIVRRVAENRREALVKRPTVLYEPCNSVISFDVD